MSTPYSTPSFPAPPRPTPASATSNRLPKAPIFNPYDRFTQNEFDSWIGGITGALRRALGQEEDEEELESVTQGQASDLFAPRNNGDGEAELSPEYEPEESSEAEDSFAEIKTRIDKGKGRDPREGPGLGGRFQPIEILYSDSEEEEEDGEGEEEIEDDEVEEESEYGWRQYDSDGNRYDEYEGSGEEYEEEGSGQRVKDGSPEDIIELSSGEDEEEGEEEEEEEEEDGSFEEEDAHQDVHEDEDIGSPDASDGGMLDITQFGQLLPPQTGDEDILDEEQEEHPQEDVEPVTYATRTPLLPPQTGDEDILDEEQEEHPQEDVEPVTYATRTPLPPQDGDEHKLGEGQGEHPQQEEEQGLYVTQQPLPPQDGDEDMVGEEQQEHLQEEEQGLYTIQQPLPPQDGGEDILGEEQEERPRGEEEGGLYTTQQPLPPQDGGEDILGEEQEEHPQEEEERGLYTTQQPLPPQDGGEDILGEKQEEHVQEEEEQGLYTTQQLLPSQDGGEDIFGEEQEGHPQEEERGLYAAQQPLLPQGGNENIPGEEQEEHPQEEEEEQGLYSSQQSLPPQDVEERALREEEERPQEEEEQDFPPRRSPSQPPDLADPWVGPQTYAEDFYSGGDIREGVLDPELVSPSNLTPVRAHSEHTWEEDANGLLPPTLLATRKDPIIIDVEMGEDEKDEDLLPRSSPLLSSAVEEYDSREGAYDENYEFRDSEASDEFLEEETEGERPKELAASPGIYVAAQPQTSPVDRTPISIPLAQDKLSPSIQDLSGHTNSGPAHAITPYINGTPEIIDLVDDDDDDDDDEEEERDEIYDDDDDDPPEVEELSSEDGDEEPLVGSGITSDLIWDGIPEAEEDITTQGASVKLMGNSDASAIEEPVAAELYQVNTSPSPKEAVGAADNEDTQISADQEGSVHNVANDPEVISIVDSEENASEEVHEVPADVRFKASLLESFLANADTMEQPTWNDNPPDVVAHFAQPPLSSVAEVAAVDHELGGSVVPTANRDLSEDYVDVGGDPEPHIERLSTDEATYNDHDDLSWEGLDDMRESNDASQLIVTEVLSQGVHYTVSEVVDDDGQHLTMSPDRNTDVASVVGDYTGDFIPYVVEEPILEDRMTQEPAERGETGDVEGNVPMLSNEDRIPILSVAQNPPDFASTEILQSTLIPGNDVHSHHQTSSPQGMPETSSVEHSLANEPMLFDDIAVPAWKPLEEVRTFGATVGSVPAPDPLESVEVIVPAREPPEEEGDRNAYAFPIPISEDPSVPDPASILQMPEAHSTPDPSSTHPEASHHSALAPTENPSETVPPYALATPVEEEHFNASANILFAPENEVPPGSSDPRPIEPDGAKDNVRVTLGEPKRSATPILEALSMPIETTDISNGKARHADDTAPINSDVALPHSVQPPEPAKSLGAVEDELDPFKLMGNDSKVAPGGVDDQHTSETQDNRMDDRMDDFQWPSQEIRDEETLPSNESINGAGPQVDEEQGATVTATSFYQNGKSLPSNDPHRSYSIDSAGDRQTKASKRKRNLPPSIPARLTRSMSSKTAPIIDYKGKSKAKADIDTASENGSSSSSASVASRMLRVSSRDTSRASSVVSTPQSVVSSTFTVQQSPTLTRQANNMSRQNQSKPFFHVHSGLHHHHRPSAVSRPSQIQRHSVAPSSQSNDTPTRSSGSQPSPSQRAAPAAHSPVTRSNCRFHRISLPREEGGPRVSFVVPGCSLGDRALMDEEDIQDEGDATTLDHARMVDDIETLDFSSDLVGILRQLVGVDLLRENEIFFLPHPGESYRRKRHGKSKLYAARSSSNDFAASLGLQSTVTPRRGPIASKISSSPSLVHAPTSASGSAPISAGSSHWNSRENDQSSPSIASYSDDETVDPDENHGSQTKRRKGPSANRNGVASSEEMPPPSSGGLPKRVSDKSGPKARRSKRLSLDAHAYKPEPETEGSTDHDSEATEGPRKTTWKRGIKRNRTNDVVGPNEGQEPPTTKRLRVRLSTSSNGRR